MRCTIYRCGLKTNLVNIPVLMEYIMILVIMEFVLTNNYKFQELPILSPQYLFTPVLRFLRRQTMAMAMMISSAAAMPRAPA